MGFLLNNAGAMRKRNRWLSAIALLAVVIVGLGSRSGLAVHLPAFIATYAGDTLWALMVFLVLGFIFVSARTTVIALLALAISFGVEISQLYQADWINAIRATRIGALALGAGFKWSDLICYSVGCGLGVIGDWLAWSRRTAKFPVAPRQATDPADDVRRRIASIRAASPQARRIARLEGEVAELKDEITVLRDEREELLELREALDHMKKEFDLLSQFFDEAISEPIVREDWIGVEGSEIPAE